MPWKDGYTISDEVGLFDHEVAWPSGNRLAVHVVLSLSLARGPAGITQGDLASPEGLFAMTEGLDALLALFEKHRMAVTAAVPAVLARAFPDRVRSLAGMGHEIAALGVAHEDTSSMTPAEEARRIALAGRLIEEVAGRRPTGWFSLPRQQDRFAGGTISSSTMRLLSEAGYSYFGNGLADDIPHYWVFDAARRQSMLTLPYYYHFDDQYFAMFPVRGSGLETTDMLARNWQAEFQAQYRRGRLFTMVLHPQHSGWCNRLAMLEQFLEHAMAYPGLWNATGEKLAGHWRSSYPSETHLKLEPPIWRDHPGSLR